MGVTRSVVDSRQSRVAGRGRSRGHNACIIYRQFSIDHSIAHARTTMSRFNNLPDIDIDADDPFSPEVYRAHLAAAGMSEQHAEAPALVRPQYSNGPAPLYQEQDHGSGFYDHQGARPPTSPYRYPEPVQDGQAGAEEQYYNEKSLVEEDLGRYQRYATPELEGGGAQQETSFDGPDEYQSTADNHAVAGQQEQRRGFFNRATQYASERRNANRSDESQQTRGGAGEGPKRHRRFVNEGRSRTACPTATTFARGLTTVVLSHTQTNSTKRWDSEEITMRTTMTSTHRTMARSPPRSSGGTGRRSVFPYTMETSSSKHPSQAASLAFSHAKGRRSSTKCGAWSWLHLMIPNRHRVKEVADRVACDPLNSYSAVTCDVSYLMLTWCARIAGELMLLVLQPDAFEGSHYTLRPAMYNRETELLIGVTMYNVGGLFPRPMPRVSITE